MALQDSLSAASISLTRAQTTLGYIFDAMSGPSVAQSNTEAKKPYVSGISGNAQDLADRMEQLENQLNGLRDVLVTPTPSELGYFAGQHDPAAAALSTGLMRGKGSY